MHPFKTIPVILTAVFGSCSCFAAAITDIQLVNNSSPTFLAVDALHAREFRTNATTPAAADVSGNTASFTNRFAWMSAHRVFPGPSDVALTFGNQVEYDLIFTVDDPALLGYSLTIDSEIRGYLTALYQANAGVFNPFVFSAGTLMAAYLDDGSGFGTMLTDIVTDAETAFADDVNPFANVLVERAGTYNAGNYVGTRTFTLRYTTLTSNTSAAVNNYIIGEANVRFGLNPTYNNFLNSAYPGIDGETLDGHGHFVTITASFNADASPVPEPATFWLVAAAGGLLAAGRLPRKR